jgi:ParB family chromosome partitioning protein
MRHGTHFVEELSRRHDAPVGRMVPLSTVVPNADQPRSSLGDLSDLVASIRAKGVLEPILVRREPQQAQAVEATARREGEPQLRIISGERRFRAAMEAGLFEVPVIELEVSEEEAMEIALIENLQRKDLTPFEEAEGYRALATRHAYTHEQIAETVGKSRSSVTESLALLQIPAKVRETAQALGVEAKSLLLELLKEKTEPQMMHLLERISRQGLNRDDLRREQKKDRRFRGANRRTPYVFKFRAPDKTFNLSLSFRQATVERSDLISALESILEQLRRESEGS